MQLQEFQIRAANDSVAVDITPILLVSSSYITRGVPETVSNLYSTAVIIIKPDPAINILNSCYIAVFVEKYLLIASLAQVSSRAIRKGENSE